MKGYSMNKLTEESKGKIISKVQTVGVNLSLMFSLIKYLDNGMLDEFNVSKIDTSNIVIVLKRLISVIIEDYGDIESFIVE